MGRRVVYYGRMAKRYGFGAPIVPFCHKVVLFRQKITNFVAECYKNITIYVCRR